MAISGALWVAAGALIENVAPDNLLARHEVFGPVLSVIAVNDVNEAMAVANSVQYGLAASVFTRDVDEALRFVRDSESGMVHVNHGTNSEAHMPFGGIKSSGLGAYSIGHQTSRRCSAEPAAHQNRHLTGE